MTAILTDSTSDLGSTLINKYGLRTIPLNVTIGGREYKDGVDIDQRELFNLVKKHGELPKTSAPSVGEFAEFFENGEDDQIFIGISSKLSATIQNALLGRDMVRKNRTLVIDSQNLSTGVGLMALRAQALSAEGNSIDQIGEKIREMLSKVRTSFMIDTMDYLYKGGRCSALQAIAGSVLKIHPIIEVRRDGSLGVKEKARGTREKGLKMLLNDLLLHQEDLDRERVFITHTGTDEEANLLKQEIRKKVEVNEISITRAGSVVSSHCGPDTVGIIYLLK